MDSPSLLEIEELAVGFKNPLVDGVGANVTSNSLIGLVGRNGVGKSTLLRTILGLQDPLHGAVRLTGHVMHSLPERERARLCSAVLTDSVQAAGLTVRNIVELGRQPYLRLLGRLSESDENQVDDAMRTMHIYHLAGRTLAELSDGERQKCMIARALAQDTQLIIMDEPLAFLDFPTKKEVLFLLRKLVSEKGKTIVFSSHELNLLPEVLDEVWIIGEGGKWQVEKNQIGKILDEQFGLTDSPFSA